MPHFSDDDKIIICCYDLQANIESLKLTLMSIEAGIQLRASKDESIDPVASSELIDLAERTMDKVAALTGRFHALRDRLFEISEPG